jgi:hypothetical protein
VWPSVLEPLQVAPFDWIAKQNPNHFGSVARHEPLAVNKAIECDRTTRSTLR